MSTENTEQTTTSPPAPKESPSYILAITFFSASLQFIYAGFAKGLPAPIVYIAVGLGLMVCGYVSVKFSQKYHPKTNNENANEDGNNQTV